jgi:hypothetical protein
MAERHVMRRVGKGAKRRAHAFEPKRKFDFDAPAARVGFASLSPPYKWLP